MLSLHGNYYFYTIISCIAIEKNIFSFFTLFIRSYLRKVLPVVLITRLQLVVFSEEAFLYFVWTLEVHATKF